MFNPDCIAFEELFFNKNVKTAIDVAQARGAAVVAARSRTEELYEYTPLQVKQAVVGYGRADKNQVQMMVKTLLGLKEIPRPDDAADAVAVAICHAHSARTAGILNSRIK
jgi:crossover junction endodeoxyribonuclease RuvC